MHQYHGKGLQHYVLTLMAVVSSIYKDKSIGNHINVVLVKLLVLHTENQGPKISGDAPATLRSFCQWQERHNEPDDANPLHFDTAILITREDICRSAGKCDTLGLAELGTMCDPSRSCAISEDSGLSTAFTIAHEIGHVFNMPHDDDLKCREHMQKSRDRQYHVMAPTLDYHTHPWSWSACSLYYLTDFLDKGNGECLTDRPATETSNLQDQVDEKAKMLPGELYNGHVQCELVFGPGSKVCPYMPKCKRLWCTGPRGAENTGCRTHHMPWADGSECDRHMWCWRGSCEHIDLQHHKRTVDGGWSEWSSWSRCSRSCGGGIAVSERICNNPEPQNGGKFCTGWREKYRSCNTQNCSPGGKYEDFRAEQCAAFNSKHTNMENFRANSHWVPKYHGIPLSEQCRLICRINGTLHQYELAPKVRDGTKCNPRTDDVCVKGICVRAGCDNKLNSNLTRDKCGVCGGDNSFCKKINGSYNDVQYGYKTIHRVPAGATYLKVTQKGYHDSKDDDNYLALMTTQQRYLLNGNYMVSMFKKDIKIGNVKLTYSGSNEITETISLPAGKILPEDIIIQVLSVGQLHPPNVYWEYMIKETGVQLSQITYRWDRSTARYTRCSHICNGYMEKIQLCVREDNGQTVADFRCNHLPRPPRIRFRCGDNCTLTWLTTWTSECSSPCGKGTKRRTIQCGKIFKEGGIKYVSDDNCVKEHGPKPAERIECHGYCPVMHWVYSAWNECSKSCGTGKRYRTAQCYDNNNNRRDEADCEDIPKELEQKCNPLPCPEWRTSPWTACTATCGKAVKYRTVSCTRDKRDVNFHHCDKKKKPAAVANCPFEVCPRWTTGPWSQCQGRCDTGTHMRAVKCIASDGRTFLEDGSCNTKIRPIDVEECSLPPCQPTNQPTLPSSPTNRQRPYSPYSPYPRQQQPSPPDSSSPHHPPNQSPPTHHRPSTQTYWRTGAWTSCSKTCGTGIRKRYVRCYDSVNNVKALHECSAPKPAEEEQCNQMPCGLWRTGKWNACSVTCGEGVQKRLVKCIMLDKQTEATDCEMDLRPLSEQACNRQPCIHGNYDIARINNNEVVGTLQWRTWPWEPCSSSCEGGIKRRRVDCYDEKGPAQGCDKRWRPREIMECNSGPCPIWHYTDWGGCSVSCGGGIKTRQVKCQWRSGHPMPNKSCNLRERPFDTLRCNTQPCESQREQWPRAGSQWILK